MKRDSSFVCWGFRDKNGVAMSGVADAIQQRTRARSALFTRLKGEEEISHLGLDLMLDCCVGLLDDY